jgi:hypothetical protein
MSLRRTKLSLVLLALVVSILACGAPGNEQPTQVPAATEVATQEAATEQPAVVPVTGNDLAGAGGLNSAPETIQHTTIPVALPADRSSHAGDYDSSTTAKNKIAPGGDRFTYGKFERPFNANTMDVYFPELDIIDTFVFQDETWIYGTITLAGLDANNAASGKYAIELDTDLDGKGDWLIIASAPTADWSTTGVQVYQDANKDVGNVSAMFTDEKATGDGFEKLVFDQGTGDDADAAWARISPNDPKSIEISVKRSVLGNPNKYLINMWAGHTLLDPSLFDINDHFTQEQAGAADPGLQLFYPIKEVSELDNSCRMAVGFEPTGQEPGLCEVFVPVINVPPTPKPTDPPPPPQACQAPPSCTGRSHEWNEKTCTCIDILY